MNEARRRFLGVLIVIGAGTLFSALAGSMVNLALPSIGRDLGLSVSGWRWIVQGFLLANASLLIPLGRLGDLLSHRRLYVAGLLFAGAASLVCAGSNSFAMLMVGRVLQGVGAAMAMAAGPAVLTTALPSSQRGTALGLAATATYTGLTAGPPLGGVLLTVSSWRTIFVFGAVGSLAVGCAALRALPSVQPRREQRYDWRGGLTLATGLVLVLVTLGQSREWGHAPGAHAVAAAGGLLLLVGFVVGQRAASSPLLDLGLFSSNAFRGAALSALANYTALFSATLLLPFYLEEGLGLASAASGAILSAQPLAMALVASPSGALSDRRGTHGPAIAGMAILVVGMLGLSTVGATTHGGWVVAWLAVMGLGTGIFISPNSSALLGSAPLSQQGAAASLLALARIVGMYLGVASATLVFQLAGGETGRLWEARDYVALSWALRGGALVAFLGLLASGWRGQAAVRAEPAREH